MDLQTWAADKNFKIAWGNIGCLTDSLEQFRTIFSAGDLNDLQRDKYNEWITQDFSEGNQTGTVILIVYSTAGGTSRITFDFDGEKMETLLPPCYGDSGLSWEYEMSIEKELSNYLAEYGYKVQRLSGPYKNLAVRLGLGKYGRNNLIYVDGFGSYIRIVGFVMNAELNPVSYPGNTSGETSLDLCKKCKLCRTNCPTQAIRDDRFLLNVDCCLSYQNENVENWPEFVGTAENKCLVGCITCQNVCPYNRGFTDVGIEKRVRFGREETDHILGKDCEVAESIMDGIDKKLEELGLSRYKDFLFRNIRAVFQRSSNTEK